MPHQEDLVDGDELKRLDCALGPGRLHKTGGQVTVPHKRASVMATHITKASRRL